MIFPVAMNQPSDGLGQWDDIISSIAKIGTVYITSQTQSSAVAATNTTLANNLAIIRAQQAQQAQQAGAVPIMSSPYFIPLVAGLSFLFIVTIMGGKR